MKNRDVTFILKLKDTATAHWKKFQGTVAADTKSIGAGFTNMGSMLKTALAGAATFSFLKQSVTAFAESEKAATKLRSALRGVGEGTAEAEQGMLAYAESLQKVTTFSDEEITTTAALLMQMTGLTTQAVKPLTEAVLDLATAKEMDAETAARLVGATINGQESLKRYGIEIGKVHGEVNRANAILNAVRESIGSVAREMGGTTLGKMKQFANAWDNIQENVGATVSKGLVPMLGHLTPILNSISAIVVSAVGGFTAFFTILGAVVNALHAARMGLKAWVEGNDEYAKQAAFAWEAAKKGIIDVGDIGKQIRAAWGDAIKGIVDDFSKGGDKAGNEYAKGVAKGIESVDVRVAIAQSGAEMIRVQGMTMKRMDALWEAHRKKALDEMNKIKTGMQIQAVAIQSNVKTVWEYVNEEMEAMTWRTIEAVQVLQGAFSVGFEAMLQGGRDAFKVFIKAILTGFIDMVQGMLYATFAAMWMKGVLTWGATLAADIAALVAATAALQLARAVVATMHTGGTAYIDAPESKEVPIMVRGGETVRVTTPEQERERTEARPAAINITINNHSSMTALDGIKKAVQEGLRKTGLTAEAFFITNPRVRTL